MSLKAGLEVSKGPVHFLFWPSNKDVVLSYCPSAVSAAILLSRC